MDLQTRPLRGTHVLSQGVPGKVVLLTPEDGNYFSINEVGARVWELCDGARSVAEIIATIADEYDAPVETIEVDVRELLEELASQHLVAIE